MKTLVLAFGIFLNIHVAAHATNTTLPPPPTPPVQPPVVDQNSWISLKQDEQDSIYLALRKSIEAHSYQCTTDDPASDSSYVLPAGTSWTLRGTLNKNKRQTEPMYQLVSDGSVVTFTLDATEQTVVHVDQVVTEPIFVTVPEWTHHYYCDLKY